MVRYGPGLSARNRCEEDNLEDRAAMKFTIIAQQDCIYCAKARELLFNEGYEFDYVTLDNKPELKAFIKDLFPSVPVIFVRKGDGFPTLIGGYEDLKSWVAMRKYLVLPQLPY